MGYTNSPLVDCRVPSPNHSGERKHVIDRITPHCVVGQLTALGIGYCFDEPSREASCNYGIGTEGKVCLIVDEKNRSWCTSSEANDQRAITIECASDKNHPYEFNTLVYNKLIDLCTDICKRNGKTKLLWFGDKEKTLSYKPAEDEMVLTVHRWFANKSCPGDWLYSRLHKVAAIVTSRLSIPEKESNVIYRVQVGAYSLINNALAMQRKLKQAGFDTYLIRSEDGFYKVQTGAYKEFDNVKAQADRLKAAGFGVFITTKSGEPVFADKEEQKDSIIKEGDIVKIQKDAPAYGKSYGFQDWVYKTELIVRGVFGDMVIVSTVEKGPITGSVDKKYLTKV